MQSLYFFAEVLHPTSLFSSQPPELHLTPRNCARYVLSENTNGKCLEAACGNPMTNRLSMLQVLAKVIN